jgi:hypothetical protein
VGRDYDAD